MGNAGPLHFLEAATVLAWILSRAVPGNFRGALKARGLKALVTWKSNVPGSRGLATGLAAGTTTTLGCRPPPPS
jgi:hypothetical protein